MKHAIETELLAKVGKVLRADLASKTSIGKKAVNDPSLVFDLEEGRELRKATRERLHRHLDDLLGSVS